MPDRAIAELAARQRGVVARRQLLAAGVSPGQIGRRLERGLLHPVHRGVYLVGHPLPAPLAMEVAALLATGPGAVLTHATAARLHGLLPSDPRAPIDVTLGRSHRERRGTRVHRRQLVSDEIVRHQGVPLTAPTRTLRDLATIVEPAVLEQAVAEALRRRLTSESELNRQTGPGARRLRSAVHAGPQLTRSEAERRLLDLVRDARLPSPRLNERVTGHEVDFHWPDHRLVAEVDGYAYHAGRQAFERDRARDADLLAAGWRVLRLTWRQVDAEPMAVIARLAGLLAVH